MVATVPVMPLVSQRFRLRGLLGQGGMGFVYEADVVTPSPALPPVVAIKVLRPEHLHDGQVRARFVEEGRACLQLQHPNLVRVFEADTGQDGTPYLVMERLGGQALSSLAPLGHPLAAPRAAAILQGVLAGLGAAHARGIVHRDLKPENIWVQPGDVAKILDFGIAKVMDAAGGMGARTSTGMVLGTPAFMSPEQLRSARDADHRSDLWSAAILLYEVLTGRHPFLAPTEVARLTLILTAEADAPSTISPVLAPFDAFFQRALQKDRALRFQSAAEMSHALAALRVQGVSLPPSTMVLTEAPPAGPTLSSKHSTLESKLAAQPPSYHPPPPIHVLPSSVQDPSSFAGDRPARGVSQILVVLLVCAALMAGFVLGFAVARSM